MLKNIMKSEAVQLLVQHALGHKSTSTLGAGTIVDRKKVLKQAGVVHNIKSQ